jgi:hypothetical protein
MEEFYKEILQDRLSEDLQKTHPNMFQSEDTKHLSLTAKATYILAIEIARKHEGWIPSDPAEFLRELGIPVTPAYKRGVEENLKELQEFGLIGGGPQ